MTSTQFIPSQKLLAILLGLEDLDGLERLSRAISALDAITPERTRDREMAAGQAGYRLPVQMRTKDSKGLSTG
jgi:hypothetical protein